MARRNPLGRIKDAAIDTLKHPVGTAERTVGLGLTVAGAVTRSAATHALRTAGAVSSLVPGMKAAAPSGSPSGDAAPGAASPDAPRTASGPRPDPQAPAPADLPGAVPARGSAKKHGDPAEPIMRSQATEARAEAEGGGPTDRDQPVRMQADVVEPLVRKQAAKKATARKAAAKSPAAKKSAAQKTPAKKAPAAAKKTAADSPPPLTAIDAAADPSDVDVTPADIASVVARKAPAQGAASKQGAARKAPAGRAAPPLSAEELAGGAGTEVITPAGTRGADTGTNPDTTETGLLPGDTGPLVDPATTKAVASESEILSRASDPDKG